jgi:hypothetical protein
MKKEIIKSFNRINDEINRVLELLHENEVEDGFELDSMLNLVSNALDQIEGKILKTLDKK